MHIDPNDLINTEDEEETLAEDETTAEEETAAAKQEKSKEKSKSKLNNHIAIAIALMSTFMGICKIKDDNIVQGMQQAQADRIDNWTWYQSRNIRQEIAKATVVQLQLQESSQPPSRRPLYDKQIAFYQDLAKRENQKKEELQLVAANDQKKYDQLNFHDDQFDLSDAFLSIAISMLAVTSLVQKRWLFGIALLPMGFGYLMGLAGLFNWNIHPDALTKLLSMNPQKQPTTWIVTSKGWGRGEGN